MGVHCSEGLWALHLRPRSCWTAHFWRGREEGNRETEKEQKKESRILPNHRHLSISLDEITLSSLDHPHSHASRDADGPPQAASRSRPCTEYSVLVLRTSSVVPHSTQTHAERMQTTTVLPAFSVALPVRSTCFTPCSMYTHFFATPTVVRVTLACHIMQGSGNRKQTGRTDSTFCSNTRQELSRSGRNTGSTGQWRRAAATQGAKSTSRTSEGSRRSSNYCTYDCTEESPDKLIYF